MNINEQIKKIVNDTHLTKREKMSDLDILFTDRTDLKFIERMEFLEKYIYPILNK